MTKIKIPTIDQEKKLHKSGYKLIAGIDEVGRGSLAGPLMAAAVILPTEDIELPNLRDSKLTTLKQREKLFEIIDKEAVAWSVGIVNSKQIDQRGVTWAVKEAMRLAVDQLITQPEYLLVDAMKLDSPYPSEGIVKGDRDVRVIAAASIMAKISRDNFMKELHDQYPMYGFNTNVGYGTALHREMIQKHGPCPEHRRLFKWS